MEKNFETNNEIAKEAEQKDIKSNEGYLFQFMKTLIEKYGVFPF